MNEPPAMTPREAFLVEPPDPVLILDTLQENTSALPVMVVMDATEMAVCDEIVERLERQPDPPPGAQRVDTHRAIHALFVVVAETTGRESEFAHNIPVMEKVGAELLKRAGALALQGSRRPHLTALGLGKAPKNRRTRENYAAASAIVDDMLANEPAVLRAMISGAEGSGLLPETTLDTVRSRCGNVLTELIVAAYEAGFPEREAGRQAEAFMSSLVGYIKYRTGIAGSPHLTLERLQPHVLDYLASPPTSEAPVVSKPPEPEPEPRPKQKPKPDPTKATTSAPATKAATQDANAGNETAATKTTEASDSPPRVADTPPLPATTPRKRSRRTHPAPAGGQSSGTPAGPQEGQVPKEPQPRATQTPPSRRKPSARPERPSRPAASYKDGIPILTPEEAGRDILGWYPISKVLEKLNITAAGFVRLVEITDKARGMGDPAKRQRRIVSGKRHMMQVHTNLVQRLIAQAATLEPAPSGSTSHSDLAREVNLPDGRLIEYMRSRGFSTDGNWVVAYGDTIGQPKDVFYFGLFSSRVRKLYQREWEAKQKSTSPSQEAAGINVLP